MSAIPLSIVMIFSIPLAAIIGGILLAALKIVKSEGSRQASAEEARIIQDIYQGLQKMEKRVEALETILLEKEPKGRDT